MGVIVGYLLGSIPFAYLLGRWRGIDIRQQGSGNVGTMNMVQVLGRGFGLAVLLLDVGKGVLVVIVAGFLQVSPYSALAAAVLGHCYPFWLGGRGGKGLATTLGGILYLQQWWLIPVFGIGWVLVYCWRRHSDLANFIGIIGLALYTAELHNSEPRLWLTVTALIILIRHLQELLPFKLTKKART